MPRLRNSMFWQSTATLLFLLTACGGDAVISEPDGSADDAGDGAVVDTGTTPMDTGPPTEDGGAVEHRGYLYFAINVHDIMNVEDSAQTLLSLIEIFERYEVRGDFYLTPNMVMLYQERTPEVITRLRDSEMTISHHHRPPYPFYPGFDAAIQDEDDATLAQLMRDYERYPMDLSTGELDRDAEGGYRLMQEVFGRAPVTASMTASRYRPIGLPILYELGARMTVTYHEEGAPIEMPFEWLHGLLIRPSDFSVTRWAAGSEGRVNFWWNRVGREGGDPVAYLQGKLEEWDAPRLPLVTALIHENNFYRAGATPFVNVYWTDESKTEAQTPPFDLDAPDPSRSRSEENQRDILSAYESLVAWGAEHMHVVTSEDLVTLAGDTTAGR